MSASNYASIARVSPATVTRDLADLVDKGALIRTGDRRYARYHLAVPLRPVGLVRLGEAGEVVVE